MKSSLKLNKAAEDAFKLTSLLFLILWVVSIVSFLFDSWVIRVDLSAKDRWIRINPWLWFYTILLFFQCGILFIGNMGAAFVGNKVFSLFFLMINLLFSGALMLFPVSSFLGGIILSVFCSFLIFFIGLLKVQGANS
jgi:hypothetical protein